MKGTITVRETVIIDQPPEIVWDFTQNYAQRKLWDKSVISADVIQETPFKIVRIKANGGVNANFQYKLEERPYKTSLAMINTKSFLFTGGGGSWQYEASDNGTLWTQTNTLVIKQGLIGKLLKPLIAYQLRKNTRKSMLRAREILNKMVASD